MVRYLVPLVIFAILAAFLYVGLGLNPREVPSPLIDKPAPGFTLNQLHESEKAFSPDSMRGKVWLLNVWASWCVSCRQEHPVLMQLARTGQIPIYGLNYKDKRADGTNWLKQHGNPYVLSAFDGDGRVGIDYGVYGVPETYLIDKEGVIRHKVIGPVAPDIVRTCLIPAAQLLNTAAANDAGVPAKVKELCL